MSAHRDPDTVAEYAKNARMRGLRVIIAGAGLAAALPGVVAAHTDLPVIGVPLTSKTSVARRARRAARDRADAARRARGARGGGQPQERGRARGAHPRRVIERYTRPEMGAVWSERRKLDTWLQVELAVVDALAEQGVVPEEDAATIRDRATFTVEAVKEREQVTDHDVAAFVDVVAGSVGEAGRWVHHGLTSSDVLDTALGLQLSQAGLILVGGAADYRDALVARAREHVDTLCVGRTHGVHAEPTTFGVKLAGFAFEAHRNLRRLERAAEARVGRRAVGRGRHLRGERPRGGGGGAEAARPRARGRLDPGGAARPPRRAAVGDRAGGRRAGALRHRDPAPPAHRGARGGGAVPRRRPEGLVGDAAQAQPDRLASGSPGSRGCCAATRRPGSRTSRSGTSATSRHSSVERVTLPDATILLDYAQHLAIRVVEGMTVHEDRMRENLDATHGALYSQRALLALVEAGRSRDDAYRIVQEAAQRAWDEGTPFRDLLAEAAPELDLDAVFDPAAFMRHARRDRRPARPHRVAVQPGRNPV